MQNSLDKLRLDLINFLKDRYEMNGIIQSPLDELDFYFSEEPTSFTSIMYEPSLCIILQGEKAVGFGDKMYGYKTNEYLLASTYLPADIRIIEASKENPYVSFRLKFSLEDIYEVLKNSNPNNIQYGKNSEKGLFFDNLNERLYEPVARLIKLTERREEDIKYLAPMIIKEILYVLINDKSGYFLNKFAMEGTVSNKIVKAISEIKTNFSEKLNIKELANSLQMSESSLYQNFKTITSMSPIQFQKKLRLEEARQMIEVRNIEISEIAYLVGYESPSQFSREFSRMFDMSPKAYLKQVKKIA